MYTLQFYSFIYEHLKFSMESHTELGFFSNSHIEQQQHWDIDLLSTPEENLTTSPNCSIQRIFKFSDHVNQYRFILVFIMFLLLFLKDFNRRSTWIHFKPVCYNYLC